MPHHCLSARPARRPLQEGHHASRYRRVGGHFFVKLNADDLAPLGAGPTAAKLPLSPFGEAAPAR